MQIFPISSKIQWYPRFWAWICFDLVKQIFMVFHYLFISSWIENPTRLASYLAVEIFSNLAEIPWRKNHILFKSSRPNPILLYLLWCSRNLVGRKRNLDQIFKAKSNLYASPFGQPKSFVYLNLCCRDLQALIPILAYLLLCSRSPPWLRLNLWSNGSMGWNQNLHAT